MTSSPMSGDAAAAARVGTACAAAGPAQAVDGVIAWRRHAGWGVVWTAWTFHACLYAQLFLAGLAVFDGPGWWASHRAFVNLFQGLPLLAVVLALAAGQPRRVVGLAAACFVLVGTQYLTAGLRGSAPGSAWRGIAALHAANAGALIVVSGALARRARAALTRRGS